MALYTCTKCGKKVPTQYETCPYCGAPQPSVKELPLDINKMKQCKACGKLIAKSAKVCPKCGEKQKKKHPILGAFLIILGVLIIAAAIGGNSEKGPKKVGDLSSSQSDPVKDQDPESSTFGVGEKVELNDIIVTLNSVTESTGKQFLEPSEGNVYLLCEFTIENNSKKELNISSILCFDGYVDDYSTSFSITAQSASDKGQLDGTIAVGKKMNGAIGYEVLTDWHEIEIHFTPDFWTGKDIIFLYKK